MKFAGQKLQLVGLPCWHIFAMMRLLEDIIPSMKLFEGLEDARVWNPSMVWERKEPDNRRLEAILLRFLMVGSWESMQKLNHLI